MSYFKMLSHPVVILLISCTMNTRLSLNLAGRPRSGSVCVCVLSHVWLFETPWIVALQAPCRWDFPDKNAGVVAISSSRESSSSKDWNHVLCLLHWQACSLPLSHLGSPGCAADLLFTIHSERNHHQSVPAFFFPELHFSCLDLVCESKPVFPSLT